MSGWEKFRRGLSKALGRQKPKKPRLYYTRDMRDLLRQWHEELEAKPFTRLWLKRYGNDLRHWPLRTWNSLLTHKWRLESTLERAKKGWSPADLDCGEYYLAKMVSEMALYLRDYGHLAVYARDAQGNHIPETDPENWHTELVILSDRERYDLFTLIASGLQQFCLWRDSLQDQLLDASYSHKDRWWESDGPAVRDEVAWQRYQDEEARVQEALRESWQLFALYADEFSD